MTWKDTERWLGIFVSFLLMCYLTTLAWNELFKYNDNMQTEYTRVLSFVFICYIVKVFHNGLKAMDIK